MTKRTLPIITCIVILVVAPVLLIWLSNRPIPQLDGREVCPDLEKAVTVKFDSHDIPYIEAYSEADAYEAQGYITARERMFQMDTLRRSAVGRLSQVYGMECLQSDRLIRTIGIKNLADAEWKNLSSPAKEALTAYAHGVNAYLAAYSNRLPVEFSLLGYTPEQWEPQDSLAVMKFQAYKMDESWRLDDLRQRVANKVGEKVAGDLFRDDLSPFGLFNTPQAAPVPSSFSSRPSTNGSRGGKQQIQTKPRGTQNYLRPLTPDSPRRLSMQSMYSNQATQSIQTRQTGQVMSLGDGIAAEPAVAGVPPAPVAEQLLAALDSFGARANARNQDRSQPLWGSTAWVVPPAASHSGGALLACDKDGQFMVPSDWFLCSLNTPAMHVVGATMPGVPGVAIGRTEGIAWGSASLKADVQDIFLEQFQSQFDSSYKNPAGLAKADINTELIPVRFGQDVQQKVFITRHGPVLLRVNQAAISLAWTGFDTTHPTIESLLKLNHANNMQDVAKALAHYSDPPQMFVFADRAGDVGYQAAGELPVRIGGSQGTMLNAGDQNRGAWSGFVTTERLPQGLIQHTTGGIKIPIVASNQSLSNGGVMPQFNGVLIGHQWLPPYRANRLLNTINAVSNSIDLSSREMNQLQGDQYSELATLVTKTLQGAALSTSYIDKTGVSSIAMLLKWDGQMRASGAPASLLETLLETTVRRSVEPQLGRDLTTEYFQRWPLWLTQAEHIFRDRPANMLPPEERTYDTFFLTSLVQSMKSLNISFSSNQPREWLWGKVHQAVFRDMASRGGAWFGRFDRLGPVSIGGASECVNSCDVLPDSRSLTFWSNSGPTERMVIDMADSNKFYQAISTGQSGHWLSPFREDQLSLWQRVDLIPIAFSPGQRMLQTKQHTLILDN